MKHPPLPRLHIVTDDRILARSDFDDQVRRLFAGGRGRTAIHIRGHETAGVDLWRRASSAQRAAVDHGGTVFVNDRVDVAIAVGAHGVQLGQASLDPAVVRELIGEGPVIGASVHTAGEAERAVRSGADALIAGTLYRSRSHPGEPPAGVDWVAGLLTLGRPVIGIGGVSIEHVGELVDLGLYGVAVISAIWEADDPSAAQRRFLARLPESD